MIIGVGGSPNDIPGPARGVGRIFSFDEWRSNITPTSDALLLSGSMARADEASFSFVASLVKLVCRHTKVIPSYGEPTHQDTLPELSKLRTQAPLARAARA